MENFKSKFINKICKVKEYYKDNVNLNNNREFF